MLSSRDGPEKANQETQAEAEWSASFFRVRDMAEEAETECQKLLSSLAAGQKKGIDARKMGNHKQKEHQQQEKKIGHKNIYSRLEEKNPN